MPQLEGLLPHKPALHLGDAIVVSHPEMTYWELDPYVCSSSFPPLSFADITMVDPGLLQPEESRILRRDVCTTWQV